MGGHWASVFLLPSVACHDTRGYALPCFASLRFAALRFAALCCALLRFACAALRHAPDQRGEDEGAVADKREAPVRENGGGGGGGGRVGGVVRGGGGGGERVDKAAEDHGGHGAPGEAEEEAGQSGKAGRQAGRFMLDATPRNKQHSGGGGWAGSGRGMGYGREKARRGDRR
jgi:hypothetical protein